MASFSLRASFRGHSAYIGQQVAVFYRRHLLHSRRVRRQYSERRANADVVHVEVTAGVVIVVAGWRLDQGACAGLELGAHQASVGAVTERYCVFLDLGLRRSSPGVCATGNQPHEAKDETGADVVVCGSTAPYKSGALIVLVRLDGATRWRPS